VSSFKIGDEVYASPNVFRDGANADTLAVDSRSVSLKPKTLDHTASAVLPLVSLTAWESLHLRANVQLDSSCSFMQGREVLVILLSNLRNFRIVMSLQQLDETSRFNL
jgi:NADPH:quinone reductase-like Zn-dependent oxidoreductase